MSEVEHATQRNAAAAQELAATAAEMADSAEALRRLLSRFRVGVAMPEVGLASGHGASQLLAAAGPSGEL